MQLLIEPHQDVSYISIHNNISHASLTLLRVNTIEVATKCNRVRAKQLFANRPYGDSDKRAQSIIYSLRPRIMSFTTSEVVSGQCLGSSQLSMPSSDFSASCVCSI